MSRNNGEASLLGSQVLLHLSVAIAFLPKMHFCIAGHIAVMGLFIALRSLYFKEELHVQEK